MKRNLKKYFISFKDIHQTLLTQLNFFNQLKKIEVN